MQSLLGATQPKSRRYYRKSEYLPRARAALCERVLVHAATIRSPVSAIILCHLDGAPKRLSPAHSPAGGLKGRRIVSNASAPTMATITV